MSFLVLQSSSSVSERVGCFTDGHVVVVGLWFFLVLQLVGLQCAIVIFPDVTFLDIFY